MAGILQLVSSELLPNSKLKLLKSQSPKPPRAPKLYSICKNLITLRSCTFHECLGFREFIKESLDPKPMKPLWNPFFLILSPDRTPSPPPPPPPNPQQFLSRIASSASPTPDTVRSADPGLVGYVLGVWGFVFRDLVVEDLAGGLTK